MALSIFPVLSFLLYAGLVSPANYVSETKQSIIISNPFPENEAVYGGNTLCVHVYGSEKNAFTVKIYGRKKISAKNKSVHTPEAPFQLLGENNQAQTAEKNCIAWDPLEDGATYEWYVTVQSADGTENSRVWTFTKKSRQ
jgi:hypothetical protein